MSLVRTILISALLMVSSFSAFAGDELLNGGDVIECPSYEVPFYLSLDLYEGQAIYKLTPIDFTGIKDFRLILKNLINRIASFDATRANLYRTYLESFDRDSRFISGTEFGDIRDEGGVIAIPSGCQPKQAAAQFRSQTPDGIKYLFNATLWARMSPSVQAGLVMHEFIYREGLLPKNNFKNSQRVRYFNAYVHSANMVQGTKTAYANAVSFAGFKN
ncbi:hypothetical protein [Bdellovibrio sp. HCB288]|uniref:hypothetical protein n=1 Tax=Bdellovibrio sp. HCB288 TaxID=3394355 RepID=UPI0039B4598F